MGKNKFVQFLEENNLLTAEFSKLSKIPEKMVLSWENIDLPAWVNDIINSKEFITRLREFSEKAASKYVETIQIGQSLRRIPAYENSLAALYPELCEEWNYEKNGHLKPEYFTEGSECKVWWICSNGHSFQRVIRDRTRVSMTMCPVCGVSKNIVPNNITISYPSLMEEWDYEKNTLLPTQVAPRSRAIVSWKCKYCSKKWDSRIGNRTCNASDTGGCGRCRKLRINMFTGKTLAKLFPEKATEWHHELNKDLYITPEEISATSNEVVWWKCKRSGHQWKAKIQHRTDTRNHGECPLCYAEHHIVPEVTSDLKTSPAEIISFLLVNKLNQVQFSKLLGISRKRIPGWLKEETPIPDYIKERMVEVQKTLDKGN